VTVAFHLAYAIAIFLAFGAAGTIPGLLSSLLVPHGPERSLITATAIATAGWIWIGWIEKPYGISRPGLIVYAAVGAAGFVRGWLLGNRAASAWRGRSP
jgi:hypothetical protein